MHISSPSFRAALHIVERLRVCGHQAYMAGGCVRDLLLGIEPTDYDVATSARPEEVVGLFPRTFAVGAHFGVILVCTSGEDGVGEIKTEVATFRSDGVYLDGRRPAEVTYSNSPEEDVQRRDFTINGMLLDPVGLDLADFDPADSAPEKIGEKVLDFVHGREDLAAKTVRAIGDAATRFREDKLRMLRAVRFAARFDFTIEPETLRAIQHHAADVHSVSNERIRDELTRMLTEGHARRAFELLDETHLLYQVLPEIARMKGVQQPPQFHPEGDVWVHTLLLLEKLPAGASPTLAWGALLHDIGKPPTFRPPDPSHAKPRIRFDGHAEVGTTMARELLNRFRFSNDEIAQITALVANHMRFGDVRQMRPATLKRFFRLNDFPEHLQLHWMDASSAHGDLSLYHYAKEQYEATPVESHKPALLLTGRDLIDAGLKPGPRFKDLLHQLEDAQLEGAIRTRDEAINMLRTLLAERSI